MEKKAKKSNVLVHVVTPFILLFLCVGILIIALIKPSDKLKVYVNLAFMDDLKTSPEAAGSGLFLKDNDIVEDYDGETFDDGEIIRPKFGEMYASLKCTAFDISVPVYWGSNSELFEHGACQSSGSAVIGDDGNTVISAHEDTFFSELYKLKKGDTVTLNTIYGEFKYKVTETITFNKKEGKYVAPSKDSKLTLYTCKRNVLGSADERIGVICEPTEKKFYNKSGEADAK
ncbi:class D sortase [Ruminococcus flavefaciens]|uniref:class D sortase n=1 Tax=Ruminococcus flavefaciens TaxID=1265 RepID=UPI000490B7DE|nr:class D sortase [Ruminococcus flavefaciens]